MVKALQESKLNCTTERESGREGRKRERQREREEDEVIDEKRGELARNFFLNYKKFI
jgi:hypothetical protein